MELQSTRRRFAAGLGITVMGLLLVACAPQEPPAPGSYQEQLNARKKKWAEWGQGHDTK